MTNVQELNRELVDRLVEEAKRDPQSVYAGKIVGIANGKIVVVSDDLNEIARRLQDVEPDPQKTFFVEPRGDLSKVEEIWEVA